jgi:hypothetical protein
MGWTSLLRFVSQMGRHTGIDELVAFSAVWFCCTAREAEDDAQFEGKNCRAIFSLKLETLKP